MKKMRIYLVAALIGLSALCVHADSSRTLVRTVEKLAEGVYTIRHKDAPDLFPQGNTTVIIGEREVLVVDSTYLPSTAREDIAQIRQWTNKPVRYLVNTHWHFDHTMGNGAYWDAFPGLSIVAHAETANQVAGYNPGWFARYPGRADRLQRMIESGKDNNGRTLSADEKKEYAEAIAGMAPVMEEIKTIKDRAPSIRFDSEMSIDLGGREVRLLHLGRGNTAGDAIIYLPKEKIVITGDLVVSPVPYLFGGYPAEFARTLRKLGRIDHAVMVPGHGNVFRGAAATAYVSQVTEFLEEVTAKVSEETHRAGSGPTNLEAVRAAVQKRMDVAGWRKRFAGDAKENIDMFDSTFAALITSAHAEISLR
jgi:cyclase